MYITVHCWAKSCTIITLAFLNRENQLSSWSPHARVPQGPGLGPLPFLYLDPCPSHPSGFKYYPNAYDSQIHIAILVFTWIPDSCCPLLTWHFHWLSNEAHILNLSKIEFLLPFLWSHNLLISGNSTPFFQGVRPQNLELSFSFFFFSFRLYIQTTENSVNPTITTYP